MPPTPGPDPGEEFPRSLSLLMRSALSFCIYIHLAYRCTSCQGEVPRGIKCVALHVCRRTAHARCADVHMYRSAVLTFSSHETYSCVIYPACPGEARPPAKRRACNRRGSHARVM